MTDAISSLLPAPPQATTTGSASETAAEALDQNFELFLALLTTQLQNQNPLDPMDTGEMTSQIVQFTSVEQTVATNANLEKLIALNQAQSSGNAVEFIGKQVEALSSAARFEAGKTTEWRYSLSEDASEITLTVVDSNGATVHSQITSANQGTHSFNWDGTLDGGGTASDGTYFLTATAVDNAGEPVKTDVRILGTVDLVDFTADPPALLINSIPVPVTNVTSVTAAP